MNGTEPLHLAVALDGAGWHPAAWRLPDARPSELFTAGYWTDLVRLAESGLLDFVTIEDSLSLQSSLPAAPDERTDEVRGRLDAVLIAARVAPNTEHIGLVPSVTVTHTEPFHASKAIATLDYVSTGRGGWRAQVTDPTDGPHFGRRSIPAVNPADAAQPEVGQVVTDLFDEAGDYVEVVRRLWDSWEDDAEIRDVASGRFVDIDRLHYVDFKGRWFSVRGPSITPRPPQGQPPVTALGHGEIAWRFAARHADVVHATPFSNGEARAIVDDVRREQQACGRAAETVHVFGDLLVYLDADEATAHARVAHLDDLAGRAYDSDAQVFVGTPAQLADLLLERRAVGLSGFRLRPAALPHDLRSIVELLVPELQRRGAFRTGYEADTLRGLLGLPRPVNRYLTSASS